MPRTFKTLAALLVPLGAAAALATAVIPTGPAQAQDWHHDNNYHRDWHHDDHWHGGGYVYAAPPPVAYVAPPAYYAPPPAVVVGVPGISVNIR